MKSEAKTIVPVEPGCIHVAQITDPHVFAAAKQQFKGMDTAMSLERVIGMIQGERKKPDLVLATGDLVHEPVPEAYMNLRRILQSAGLPVFCLPGNHDLPVMMDDLLNTGTLSCCKSVICGDWEFVLLDSTLEDNEKGYLDTAELAYLQDRISACATEHVAVCLHHQPLAIGSPWMDEMKLDNGEDLLQLVSNNPRVRCVLWGHIHQEYAAQLGDVRMLGCPATSIQFKPGTLVFEKDVLPPAYRELKFYDDGRIDSSVHWLDTSVAPD